jgi:TetR/AcrR family transcriptional regulator
MARSRSPGLDPTREELRLARKARRHTDRRSAILGAASRLLATQGTESFTVSAVAAAAGVSKPAVYYYFDSKEDLVGALVADVMQAETEAVRRATDSATDAVDALVRAVRALVEHYADDLDRYRIAYLWPHAYAIPEHLRRSPASVERDQLDANLARRLGADPSLVSVGSGRPRALVTAAFAAAHGLLTTACVAQARADPDIVALSELGAVVETLLRRALGGRESR